jgi:transcriptional regulator with XRE-family HTH domain
MSELALFAKRLEQLRKQSGLSQKALAERTNTLRYIHETSVR